MSLQERIEILLYDGEVKPRLRGVSHALGFLASLAGCVPLALAPARGTQYLAGLVFGASLVLLFGVSALYHCPNWSHATYRRLQRFDHAAINFLIAGTFTPIAVLDAKGWGPLCLGVMWTAALIGAGFAVTGHSGPRGLRSLLYFVLGAMSGPVVWQLPGIIGPERTGWLAFGAALYTVGAVIYARKWPNPRPSFFGYHEIFHLLVVVTHLDRMGGEAA